MVLGCTYLGSNFAFSAFVGSFVVRSSLSYLLAILPHLLNGRATVTSGHFWMKGAAGYIVNGISCIYISVFAVIFCFPASPEIIPATMNWTCLMTGGLVMFVTSI